MNEIQVFESEKFGQIRSVIIDEEPWFVLKDVCNAFGETNYRRVSSRLVDDEKGVSQINTPGGMQNMTVINESGIYTALFIMQPEKARGVDDEYIEKRQNELKAFKRWVTHDVLPSIRKHGMYAVDEVLANPDMLINALQALKKEREEKALLKQKNEVQALLITEMQPKVSYYDKILQSKSTVSVTQIAKDYGMSAVKFNSILHGLKVQYKQGDMWMLYQKYANKGYTKSRTYTVSDDVSRMGTYWTQNGRKFLYDILKKNGILPECERN